MKVIYRSVGKRCAVNISSLELPIPDYQALEILKGKGFIVKEVDIIALAKQCLKNSRYRRGARLLEAPAIVDCSSLVKWLYGQRGIWLPRRSIQQRELGEAIDKDKVIPGDLVFVKGAFDWYFHNPNDGVGHVGIATGYGTVIHASDPESDVVESPIDRFISRLKFRGIRRYIPNGTEIITLEVPTRVDVETSDDFRWIVLQSIPR
jgi:hypothetical protein